VVPLSGGLACGTDLWIVAEGLDEQQVRVRLAPRPLDDSLSPLYRRICGIEECDCKLFLSMEPAVHVVLDLVRAAVVT